MPLTKKAILLIAFYLRLPVIALSLGRNAYTLRLRHQASDAGLDSAIVTIWLEVQLAYALAASTLSALKAFTESFNSGFGLGFTRGKSENGSYALSAMSRSRTETGASIASRSKPDTHSNGTTSPPADIIGGKDGKFPSFIKTSHSSFTRPLRLRPDVVDSRPSATATATSEGCGWDHSRQGSAGDFNSTHRDLARVPGGLVILRETQLSVCRDLAPGYVENQHSGD